MQLNIFITEQEVLVKLATYFVAIAKEAISTKGRFSVALSGGSSPKKLYELLSSAQFCNQLNWQKVDFFFGDERNVLQDDKDSNFLMAKIALFEPLHIAADQVFAVDTRLEPTAAATAYTTLISNYFADNHPWCFDLVLLGLGDNSHTASLFPYTAVLKDISTSAKAVFLEDQKIYRITLTAPLINQAKNIAFLVYGLGKAIAVHHIIEDEKDIANFPAQLIQPVHGDLQWFLDEAAASNLQGK